MLAAVMRRELVLALVAVVGGCERSPVPPDVIEGAAVEVRPAPPPAPEARLLFTEGDGTYLGVRLARPPAASILGVRLDCRAGSVPWAPIERVVAHPRRATLLSPQLERLLEWPLPVRPDRCELSVWADTGPRSTLPPALGPTCMGPEGTDPSGCPPLPAGEPEQGPPVDVLDGVFVRAADGSADFALLSLLVRKRTSLPEGAYVALHTDCAFGTTPGGERREEAVAAWTTNEPDVLLDVPLGHAFIDGHLIAMAEGVEDCDLTVWQHGARRRRSLLWLLRRGAPLDEANPSRGYRLLAEAPPPGPRRRPRESAP